ncbi:unnamed protein product [Polarella glacialis]|uniref:Phosphodiesterase n=1 Tax=Polarella glacialis TaxID=89957 RepID=A0A813JKE0_POLGL|nr:unnamed protein product [Polarella glacialis]CAE8679631.1 unnamed protein product [Polarella glacialis]
MASIAPEDATPEGSAQEQGSPMQPDVKPPEVVVVRVRRKSVTSISSNSSWKRSLASNRGFRRAGHILKPSADSYLFKTVMVVCLIFALFGGSLWILLDIPDDPGNIVLDTLMCIVTALFVLEMIFCCLVDLAEYPLSFFFWMDVLGTASMVFEISFLLGTAGKIQTASASIDAVLLRTARAAKVGARVGRLSKLMKCLSYAFLGKVNKVNTNSTVEAKVLSQKLMLTLSTKISLLTIVLVLVVPLFSIGQYPEEDLSMRLWGQKLEGDYRRSYLDLVTSNGTTTQIFSESVGEMVKFYEDANYVPFSIVGFTEEVIFANHSASIPGASMLQQAEPVRKSSIYRQEVPVCLVVRQGCTDEARAALYFNFKSPAQVEAGENMAMIFFIILVMVLVSINLSHTLDKMVVQPMERMLTMVKSMAGDILRQFGLEDDTTDTLSNSDAGGIAEETELIEGIFKKFARLAALAAERNDMTEAELANMDQEAKGVMMEMMNVQVQESKPILLENRKNSKTKVDNHSDFLKQILGKVGTDSTADTDDADDGTFSQLLRNDAPAVSALPVPRSTVDTWALDVLALEPDGQTKIALHIFFDSRLGQSTGRSWVNVDTFHRFHTAIKGGYNDLPYHNYAHACDVLHTVYRLLVTTRAEKWLSTIDQYALMVAALCHDVGHSGKTNPFLVETNHELALRYNDNSPLENMHCARLFEVCGHDDMDIFMRMDKAAKKQVRRVCIAAILHTDNVNHFEMVREVSKVYEMAPEVCDAQARVRGGEINQNYQELVLQKNSLLWMELFLHFADVSNPLKPFEICHKWAWRVLEEFFAQGDEEKSLGLPVGMLNDRDKINRPGSQHGFINFLVAPLVASTVRIFPPLHPLYSQMASNLEEWRHLWIKDVQPSPEDVAKKDADLQKVKDIARDLRLRAEPEG